MRARGVLVAPRRERLFVRAVAQAHRIEHRRFQQLGKRPLQLFDQRELHDRRAAARILLIRKRRPLEADLADVRRFLAVEDLDDGRTRRVGVIAGKAEPVAGARRVAEQRAQRDRLRFRMFAGRHLPRFEERVDVGVERERSVLHRAHHGHRGHRLADRRGLKHRVLVNQRLALHVGHAVGLGPVDLEVLDDGDAHAGDAEARHHLLDRQRIESLAIRRLRPFDAGDVIGGRIGHGARAGGQGQDQGNAGGGDRPSRTVDNFVIGRASRASTRGEMSVMPLPILDEPARPAVHRPRARFSRLYQDQRGRASQVLAVCFAPLRGAGIAACHARSE